MGYSQEMTTNELIAKLQNFFDLKKRKQREKRDKMITLLKKLKKQQTELENKLEITGDSDKAKRMKRDLKVIYEHRRKGIKLCREIGACKK